MEKTSFPGNRAIKERFMQAMEFVPDAKRLGTLQAVNTRRVIADEAFLRTMVDVFSMPFETLPVYQRPLALLGRKLMGPKSMGDHFRAVGAYMAVENVCAPSKISPVDQQRILSKFSDPDVFEDFFKKMMEANRAKVKALNL